MVIVCGKRLKMRGPSGHQSKKMDRTNRWKTGGC
jgi:hypothetical protein